MANRNGTAVQETITKGVVSLFAKVTFGATGAPTLVTTGGISQGIKSIARTGSGAYTITFGIPDKTGTDKYNALLGWDVSFVGASSGATVPAAPVKWTVTDSVASAGTLAVKFANLSGSATDPADGEIAYLTFHMKNSTAF
jgi:hypothetical protein